METPPYKTTRIWAKTLKKLKLISAVREMSIVRVLDRIADEELERLQAAGKMP